MDKKNEVRTLTVKGTGNLEFRPDWVTVDIVVEGKSANYEKSTTDAVRKVSELSDAIVGIGFEPTDLKTAMWECEQVYKPVMQTNTTARGKKTEWNNVFRHYLTKHSLKLEYTFGEKELPAVIGVIASCKSVPEFDVHFSIKDKAAATDKVLEAATKDAFGKAKTIAKASGMKLGKPLEINYDWSEYTFQSATRLNRSDFNITSRYKSTSNALLADYTGLSVEPENIRLKDMVTFVWDIT